MPSSLPMLLCLTLGVFSLSSMARCRAEDALPSSHPAPADAIQNDLMLGVDANYSLEMERKGARWKWDGREEDLFSGMRRQGVRWFRVRLWTSDEGVSGKAYATEIVKRAERAGIAPYLVLFLSEEWADMTKQPAPEKWKGLPPEEKADAVRAYSREIVTHFRKEGLSSHLYEVGNEIDYGICGVFPGKDDGRDVETLKKRIWPEAATLILACQRGVGEADPDAKFLLHIAHWWDADFCNAFFQFMIARGVRVDYAGLSYFPSSNIGGSQTQRQFHRTVDRIAGAVHRPIIVAETGYPSSVDFHGQFAAWKNEVPGCPLTPNGQKEWLSDLIQLCLYHPKIAGIFYWSPEWYGEETWKAFALFDSDGDARPAWQAFHPEDSTPPPGSQVEVTEYVVQLACRTGEVRTPEDLVELRDLLISHLTVRPYNESTRAQEEEIRWKRTASKIIEERYVYATKACTDAVIAFLALCRAKGLDAQFVKVFKASGQVHSLAEVRLPSGWYVFDVAATGSVPVAGRITGDSGEWLLWRKGRDAWAIGLTDHDSIRKMYPSIYRARQDRTEVRPGKADEI